MTAPAPAPAAPYRRLVLRIYLLSLASIVVSGVSVAFLVKYVLEQPWKTELRPMARHLVADIVGGDKAGMEERARTIQRELEADITIYDAADRIFLTTATPAIPPLPAEDSRRVRAGETLTFDGTPPLVALPLPGGAGTGRYALLRPPLPTISPREAGLVIGIILVCFAGASVMFARLLAHPLAELGQAARAIGAGNLKARVRLDRRDEFGDLAKAFNEMADRVTEVLRSQKELMANMSHELRTPLSRIRFALELMTDGDARSARQFTGEITRDLAELERILGDILTTSRLELVTNNLGEAHPPLRLEPIHSAELIEDAVHRFRNLHVEHDLVVKVDEDLPVLEADGPLIRRAIDNLLDNASKYSDAGSEVELHARAAGGALEVEVVDNGIGIDTSELPRVFEPFYRTDRSRARTTGGIGLGLPLVRRIVRAHGGDIEIKSAVGGGTRVRLWIPAAAGEPSVG